jgi:hypothetical protein
MRIPPELEGRTTVDLWPTTAHVCNLTKYGVYEAARLGTIPTLRIGARRRVVPVIPLLKLLGYVDAEVTAEDA